MKKILLFGLLLLAGQVYSQNFTLAELLKIRTSSITDTRALLKEKGWVYFYAFAGDDDGKHPVRTFALQGEDGKPEAYLDVTMHTDRIVQLQFLRPDNLNAFLEAIKTLPGIKLHGTQVTGYRIFTDDTTAYAIESVFGKKSEGYFIEKYILTIALKKHAKFLDDRKEAYRKEQL